VAAEEAAEVSLKEVIKNLITVLLQRKCRCSQVYSSRCNGILREAINSRVRECTINRCKTRSKVRKIRLLEVMLTSKQLSASSLIKVNIIIFSKN
jgi:hypothetical protein